VKIHWYTGARICTLSWLVTSAYARQRYLPLKIETVWNFSCFSFVVVVIYERISVKVDIGDLRKSVDKPQIWLKCFKNIRHFTGRAKHVYIVDNSIKYFSARQRCKWYSLRFYGNTKSFCIIDSYLYITNAVGANCCASMTIMVSRECLIVTFCVNCLSCSLLCLAVVYVFCLL
jgi:hypothetical protein